MQTIDIFVLLLTFTGMSVSIAMMKKHLEQRLTHLETEMHLLRMMIHQQSSIQKPLNSGGLDANNRS